MFLFVTFVVVSNLHIFENNRDSFQILKVYLGEIGIIMT